MDSSNGEQRGPGSIPGYVCIDFSYANCLYLIINDQRRQSYIRNWKIPWLKFRLTFKNIFHSSLKLQYLTFFYIYIFVDRPSAQHICSTGCRYDQYKEQVRFEMFVSLFDWIKQVYTFFYAIKTSKLKIKIRCII
jgi:hypothetical protein